MVSVEADYIERLKRQLLRLDNLEEGADLENRIIGMDWPKEADTMIGLKRMDNIRYCVEEILKTNIQGDFIETGVWRGGACIFMRGILQFYNEQYKNVWVADSFKGFPVDLKYELDKEEGYIKEPILNVSLEEVQLRFERYKLLDSRVKFLKGWFKDTLPNMEGPFSLLRLDGDLYESTWDALVNLYSKLSVGGYIIIDDYWSISVCQIAVRLFRKKYNITEEMITIDNSGVYWKKEK